MPALPAAAADRSRTPLWLTYTVRPFFLRTLFPLLHLRTQPRPSHTCAANVSPLSLQPLPSMSSAPPIDPIPAQEEPNRTLLPPPRAPLTVGNVWAALKVCLQPLAHFSPPLPPKEHPLDDRSVLPLCTLHHRHPSCPHPLAPIPLAKPHTDLPSPFRPSSSPFSTPPSPQTPVPSSSRWSNPRISLPPASPRFHA